MWNLDDHQPCRTITNDREDLMSTDEEHQAGLRRLRARAAAYAMYAKNDSRETSRPGREAFLARFEREVDPESASISRSVPGAPWLPAAPTSRDWPPAAPPYGGHAADPARCGYW